jgi:hypothetical protein
VGHERRRTLDAGTVKINAVFGYGPELLDEMTAVKVVHVQSDIP